MHQCTGATAARYTIKHDTIQQQLFLEIVEISRFSKCRSILIREHRGIPVCDSNSRFHTCATTGNLNQNLSKAMGSVLMAVLYHASFNTAETILFRMVSEPTEAQELQIYIINIVLSWILAALLLAMAARRKNGKPAQALSRELAGS